MNPLAKLTGTPSFNPADHTENVLQGFTDFIETWEMWYEVASIGELKADATEVERKEHKAKVFRMCAFSGERLKVDLKAEFNQDMTALKAADFDAMTKKLYDRYKPTENRVLLHYQFHQLKQASGEKVDDFINKVCQHAEKCAFKCTNDSCTAKDAIHKTLIRDQIIIGTNIPSIREDALEREYDLATLITKARKIEATEIATKELAYETPLPFNLPVLTLKAQKLKQSVKLGKKGGSTLKKPKEGKVFWNKDPN